jgi:hypothetical protein
VTQKAVAGAEQELHLADVHVRSADAVRAVAASALLGEDPAPSGHVAAERGLVERGVRSLVPGPQEGDDGLDIGAGQGTAAQDRPRRHRRAATAVVDGLTEKVVAHRREEGGVGDGGRLIGLVAGAARSVANGAHLSVELGTALLDFGARHGVAAGRGKGDGEESGGEQEQKTAHVRK